MLKSIEVENYTTFIDKTKIDFTATNSKILDKTNVGDNKIVKGGLFVGENASGKTKTLKSIELLLKCLFSEQSINFLKYISLYSKNEECKLTYEFIINSSNIKYTIQFNFKGYTKEMLVINNKVILKRDDKKGYSMFDEKTNYNDINDNVLLLRKLYFNTRFDNNELLNEWFKFLERTIYIDCYKKEVIACSEPLHDIVYTPDFIEKYGIEDINKFLKTINYNSSLKYVNEVKKGKITIRYKGDKKGLFFRKNGTDVDIPLEEESLGNETLFHLIAPIIYASKNDCMLALDEFSSGLHNELEESLLRYFFTHSKNSQIFFVSHSTNILSNTILRPDQIYSFKFDNGTKIKRFSDESPREGQNLEKMYLSGVFDGLPNYNKFI